MPFTVFLIVFIISATLVLIAVPTLAIIRVRTRRCSKSTTGKFMGERTVGRGKNRAYIPIISYELNGVTYESETLYTEGFGGVVTPNVGTEVTVWYDPNDPYYIYATMPGKFSQRKVITVLMWVGIVGTVISGIGATVSAFMAM